MKKFLNELEKIPSINTQLQNKLGEITIWISKPENLLSITNSDTKSMILILQNFLCHKYYLDFMKLKLNEKENSIYDNCMNLILIVLAKLCKINSYNGEIMIKYFIHHINTHLDCFNHIISFYRLYITSPQLKQSGKKEELYNYLFQLYKRLYSLNYEYETKNDIKDINSIFKSGIIKQISGYNNLQDQKYLTEYYLQLTERPINKILNNDNYGNNISDNYNINSNSIGENFFHKDLKFMNNNNKISNTNKNSLSHIINSYSKTNILSRTDRKINSNNNMSNNIYSNNSNNNRQASDLNNYSSKMINEGININNNNIVLNKNINIENINQKELQNNKNIKPKIPTLKFPLDKTQPQQKFSLIRSSHRNDFSKSGDGSSTTTTKNKIFTNKLAEGSSINRHFAQDVLILEPKEKLKELALQLGENYLATDFTSLINQKRDYELEKYKTKHTKEKKENNEENILDKYNNGKTKNYSKRNNIPNSEYQSSNKLNNYIEKINNIKDNRTSDDKNLSMNLNLKNFSNKTDDFSIPDSKQSFKIKNNNVISDKSNYSISTLSNNYQNSKNFIKIREIITNFIISFLREYTEDEFKFLKIDIYTIFSYLSLPSMENLQNKSEKKRIEIIEQMKFILDKEKDAISYGNFLYLPEKIEINKKKFQLNNTYNRGISYKNIKARNNNFYNKNANKEENNLNNNNKEIKDKTDDNYNIFESLLSITLEEDNNCPLVLKNENEALYDILSMYSCNIETELKKILLYKNFHQNLDLSVNGIKFVQYNSINFDTLINHLDPFMELIINRLNLILLSTEPYNCYSNNINNRKINSMNLSDLSNSKDDYIMKLLKNYFDIIHYYINTSKNRLLKIYTLKTLKNILPLTKNIFIIIFNHLTNLNYSSGNNSNSNYNNNNYKNSSMSLDNNFTERYDFRIPNLLIDTFCSFIRLLSSFVNCFDYSTNINLSKLLNDNFISNTDWLNVIKFIFDYLFLSNLNKEYTLKGYNMNNNINNTNKTMNEKNGLGSSNSQRLGNIFFNKCSVCSILKDDNISMFNDNLSEIYKLRVKQLLPLIQFFYECNVYFQKIININISNSNNNLNNNQNNTENNMSPIINSINDADYINNKKYWSNSLNNYLLYLNMLLNSKSGSIFDFFICSNGGNFLFSKIKLSIIFTHYNLTKNLLILQESTLNFPMKYSFIMNEMTSLDVIRLHYIAFIKLYNKNIIFNTNLSEVSSIIATSENFQQKKTIKAFVKDIHNDQNLLNILLNLCKMHLRCLFVISKNRNADVTNKFFQLKIVDYFTHEIQLEHEVAEKVYKLNQFNNNQSNKNIKLNLNFDKNKNKNKEVDLNINIINKEKKEKKSNKNNNIDIKNKNPVKKLDLGKLNLGEEIQKKPNLKNIKENSLEDKENESLNKKKSDDYGLDEFSMGLDGTNEEEELENEENEELEEDFDEIPLVAPNNNACSYNTKIPKLNMLSSSFSDNEREQDDNNDNDNKNIDDNDNIEEEEEEDEDFNEEKKDEIKEEQKEDNDENKNSSGPKIILNLNLALCKTKSDKNQKLQEEINKIDKGIKVENKDNKNNVINNVKLNIKNNENNNDNTEKKEGPKIQLKLNLDLCKTKSNKNELLKNEILKNSTKLKDVTNIQNNQQKEIIKPNQNIINNTNINNKQIPQENNSSLKINNNIAKNAKKIIQLPKLNLQISKLKPKENKLVSNIKNSNSKKDTSNSNHRSQNISKDIENIKESNNRKNLNKDPSIASKIRVEIENHLKEKYKLFYQKAINEGFTEGDLVNVNQFYLKERNNRVLYQDPEIQVLIIALLFSLIITPSRGTLEELYCSVFPYENNKLNILYIIHHHLNREENYHILPLLLKFISQIHPFGAGQRLLKLTCKHFFNSSIYNNWDKIGGGQFGTVYQCSTGLTEPNIVAIKKTELEQNIFSPCHLFDIFTEVTALEALRLENCVTQLYDYGCDDEYYYIVMKRYPISLKKWRIQQKQPLKEMLPTYLSIFKDVLHAVQIIHNNKITHYDLKCDNIVLDFVSNFKESTYDVDITDENENDSICIIVADFGECRMFLNEVDEHCTRSRGTDVIKSPEMLKHFGYQIRKEDDNFDRRKKVGTTRSSDIWSLGCLFYELLTGNFLFEEIQDNYLEFMYKIDKSSINELLTEKKMSLIDNNPYLVDFLKFMLVKNQTYRPNIDTLIKRFEHVYALLEGGTGAMIQKRDFDMLQYDNKIYNESYFETSIENCEDMINNEDNTWNNSYNSNLLFNNIKLIPEILKLTKDIYIAQYDFIEDPNVYYSNINTNTNSNLTVNNSNINTTENNLVINTDTNNNINNINCNNKNIIINHSNNNPNGGKEDSINVLLSLGITHIITFTSCHKKALKNKFLLFNLNEDVNYNDIIYENNIMNNNNKKMNNRTPFEYIFKTMDFLRECMIHKGKVLFVDDYFYNNIPYKPNCLMRSMLLIIFAHFLNQSAYDTYTYLNNKLLFYNLPMIYYLPSISNWIMNQNIIFNYLSIFPIFRCFCGACQLIMRRDFIIKRKTICNCQKNDSSVRESDCPSNGCTEYIEFIKKIYNKNYNSLIWGTINLNNFYLKLDSTEEKHYKQIITFSNNLENNILENSAVEKIGVKGGLSESSMRKKTWKLYKCKICFCWIFGQCNDEIQVLLNNEYNLIKNIENRKKLIKDNELKDISLEQLI